MMNALITYDDLVGGVCGILATEAWNEPILKCYENFGTANADLTSFLTELRDNPEVEFVAIAGLPIKDDLIRWIDNEFQPGRIFMCNHHDMGFDKSLRTAAWLSEDFLMPSSDRLYREFVELNMMDENNGRLISFLSLVRIFETQDRSHALFGVAKDLNRLYHFLGFEEFVQRGYLQGYTPSERYALDMLQARERRTIKVLKPYFSTDARMLTYLWIICPYGNLVDAAGEELLNRKINSDYVAVINPAEGGVFLFSRGEVDMGAIARSVGGYGTRTKGCFYIPVLRDVVGHLKKTLNKKEK